MGKAEGAWWGLHEGCGSTWGHPGEPSEWSVCPSQVSCRDKGCVDLLEENGSVPGWSTWKRVCWRACMEWFEVVLPELMFPGRAVLRLTCACTGLI